MTWQEQFRCIGLLCLMALGCTRSNLDAIVGLPEAAGTSSTIATGGVTGIGGVPGAGGASSAGGTSGTGGTTGLGGSSSATCPTTVLQPGDTTETVPVDSTNRSYLLHVPSAYDGRKPVPLVLDFHALNVNGAVERKISPYPAQLDPEGVIMAFPNGVNGPSGAAWNLGPCCVANPNDVAFAKAVVADVQAKACIDASRVYAVGFSIGGGMAHYLGCHASDVFAAIAPAAFDLLEENVGDCRPENPVSVISFRGTADPLEPYDGGYSQVVPGMPITFLGAKKTFQKWAELNQCTDQPSSEDGNGCSTYSACKGNAEVVLCTKQGGQQEAGNAAIAWRLLQNHRRN